MIDVSISKNNRLSKIQKYIFDHGLYCLEEKISNLKKHLQKLKIMNMLNISPSNNTNVPSLRVERNRQPLFRLSFLAQPTIGVDHVKENNTEKSTFCLFTNKIYWLFEQLAYSLFFALTAIYKGICEMDKENRIIFKNGFVLVNALVATQGKFTQEVWRNNINPKKKRYLGGIFSERFQALTVKLNSIKFNRKGDVYYGNTF